MINNQDKAILLDLLITET